MATNHDATPSRRGLLTSAAIAAAIAPVAAMAPPPPAAPSPAAAGDDTELLELCSDWTANDAECVRLCELEWAMEERAAAAGVKVRWQDRVDYSAVVADGHDLLEEITATPARTAAGRRAKAAVLAARVAPGGEDPQSYNHDECLALSLARDVLAPAEGAS